MKDQDIMCYSTVAGELPIMVAKGEAECFVRWSDYVKLKEKYEEIDRMLMKLLGLEEKLQ